MFFRKNVKLNFDDLNSLLSVVNKYLKDYINNPSENYYNINTVGDGDYEVNVQMVKNNYGFIRVDGWKKECNGSSHRLLCLIYDLAELSFYEKSYFVINNKRYDFINRHNFLLDNKSNIISEFANLIVLAALRLIKELKIENIIIDRLLNNEKVYRLYNWAQEFSNNGYVRKIISISENVTTSKKQYGTIEECIYYNSAQRDAMYCKDGEYFIIADYIREKDKEQRNRYYLVVTDFNEKKGYKIINVAENKLHLANYPFPENILVGTLLDLGTVEVIKKGCFNEHCFNNLYGVSQNENK